MMHICTSRYVLTVLFFLAQTTGALLSAQIHWESMVLESDTWKYLPATSEPASDWYQPGFNDASWNSGTGGLGYADGDDATTIASCNSLYVRKQISLSDAGIVKDLLLDIDYDDAFVLYINGTECARSSNVSGAFPAYNAVLATDHEANMYRGGSPERFQLKPSSLVSGLNVFALQILNQGISSSDLSARVFIQAKIDNPSVVYHTTPSWFAEPISYDSTDLPMVFINTNGQTIIQNTKIMVDMKVLNNASGINHITDTTFEYKGKVGIEIRGNTSANFPKKSYSLETRNADGSNLNVTLLGLPKENDWVFHGPYSDKSLVRNALAYNLGNKTGHWSPRTRFFELYLNGTYNGVYVLVEKIKIDNNRCNLATLNPVDTVGDELTGGYILKLDRPESYDVEGIDYWVSPYRAPTTLQQKEYFLFVDPDGEEIMQKQRDYIKKYITDFENAMYSSSYANRAAGYYPYVDLQSFVDYYIITELSRNLDGYRISTFLHKDKDSKGGKITMGPLWDYDLCFGNANFFSAGNTTGWVIDGMGNGDAYAMPFWWQKFRLDPYFNSILKQRWNDLKSKYINTTYLNAFIDSCANVLTNGQVRNYTKWNILSTYVWPNNYVGGSYANELIYLKNWLRDRISWMDIQIQAITDITEILSPKDLMLDLATYPNPFTDRVNFKYYMGHSGRFEIVITDIIGHRVLYYNEFVGPGIHTVPLDLSSVPMGVYVYNVHVDGKILRSGKLVKQ
jgi:hypothetical protein